jgi:hypothetical protein
MSWLFQLHDAHVVAHAIGVIALVCSAGMALGSVKILGIGLGTAGVLFAASSSVTLASPSTMPRSSSGVPEQTGRLDDDIDVERLPRKSRGIALGEETHVLAVGEEAVRRPRPIAGKAAIVGVVLEELGQSRPGRRRR